MYTKEIALKYLALVERFNAAPQKSTERIKMMLAFDAWYRSNRDKLSDAEKEYLQTNICEVNDNNLWSYTY